MVKRVSKFDFSLFISTFFYVGLISKKVPGTVGSAVASLLCVVFYLLGVTKCYLVTSLFLFIIGVISSHVYLFKRQGDTNRDPGYIVIDEVTGIFIGTYILSFYNELTIWALVLNFIFFRIFDILKPFPIRNIEKLLQKNKKTAAVGIMLDDVFASILGTTLQILILFFRSLS